MVGTCGVMRPDFQKDLAYSHSLSDEPFWRDVYREAFPGLQSMVCVRGDGWAQRGGIDRVLTLASGKTLTVDEKGRREDYQDILLEYKHVYKNGRKTLGWVAKELACDYLAYALVPSKRVYLFPFQTLRRAWRLNGLQWIGQYFEAKSDNGPYTTHGICVPCDVLTKAVSDAMVVVWE